MKKKIMLLALILISSIIYAQEVKINNNLVVEADGTLRMDNAATVWDDLRVTLDKGKDAAKVAYLRGSSGPQIWFFRDNGGIESMSFTVQIPHTWKEGTTIYPHIHWVPKSTGAGDVEWNFEYTWVNYNPTTPEVFPVITTNTIVASGPFIATTNLITDLSLGGIGIDGTAKKISSVLICRIWRDSSDPDDTYNADAGAISLDFHYELNTLGSHLIYTK